MKTKVLARRAVQASLLALTFVLNGCSKREISCQIFTTDEVSRGHPIAGAKVYILPPLIAEKVSRELKQQWLPVSAARLDQATAERALRVANDQAEEAHRLHDALMAQALNLSAGGEAWAKCWKGIAETNGIEKQAKEETEKQSKVLALASQQRTTAENLFREKLASFALPAAYAITDADGRCSLTVRDGYILAVISSPVPVIFCKAIQDAPVVILTQDDAVNMPGG